MKLYYISINNNDSGKETIYYYYTFTHLENAIRQAEAINRGLIGNKIATVKEIELPFIGKYVYCVQMYSDIDYNNGSVLTIHKGFTKSQIYPCIDHAKDDKLWLDSLEYFNENPEEEKHEIMRQIATDYNGYLFARGLPCGFVTRIERFRVIKDKFCFDRSN